jgi:hypothetical protein
MKHEFGHNPLYVAQTALRLGVVTEKVVKPDMTRAATGGRDTGTADICREECNIGGRGCEKSAHYHSRSELIDVSDRIKIAVYRPS